MNKVLRTVSHLCAVAACLCIVVAIAAVAADMRPLAQALFSATVILGIGGLIITR